MKCVKFFLRDTKGVSSYILKVITSVNRIRSLHLKSCHEESCLLNTCLKVELWVVPYCYSGYKNINVFL